VTTPPSTDEMITVLQKVSVTDVYYMIYMNIDSDILRYTVIQRYRFNISMIRRNRTKC